MFLKIKKEFIVFIRRGNVLDLAVAFILGTAFSRIVTSFVADLLMPILSLLTGRDGFENYKIVLREADVSQGITENAIYYGRFLVNVFDFLIVAFVIFMIVKLINKVKTLNKQEIPSE